jgi:nitric-oxide synthase
MSASQPLSRGPIAALGGAGCDPVEAREFLQMFHAENPSAQSSFPERWDKVQAEILACGRYELTEAELTFGARAAWRHSVRCVGRLRWQGLVVRDARYLSTAAEVHEQVVEHVDVATNGGRIRSMVTVFPADTDTGPLVRIWNEQAIRYAGWSDGVGGVVGDPRYLGFTKLAEGLGWRPTRRGRFEPLPLVIETATEDPQLFTLPRESILEVPISHPEFAWFAGLGLRWHALPLITCMRMRVGGMNFPVAFNGFYLQDEIASRNLSDANRYNQVPVVARGMGLDTRSARTLWRDRSVIELNRAVLHSFDLAGVTIADHHAEAANFMRFVEREESAGRCPHADWTWINPVPVPAQVPTFHRYYDPTEVNPNFYLDPDAAKRAAGQPVDGLRHRHRRRRSRHRPGRAAVLPG